jgi:hypothetical protein
MSEEENTFPVIKPGDDAYDKVFTAVEANGPRQRTDYDPFAKRYNEAPVGSFILLETSAQARRTNVESVLQGRGLDPGKDFEATKLKTDAAGNPLPKDKRFMAIKKLSEQRMKLLSS